MSNSLSQTDREALEALQDVLGVTFHEIQRDPDGMAKAKLAREIRSLLAEATHEDKVTITELAQRIGVSKSAVSRHMNSDGDIRASTMAVIARALGRKFVVELVREGHQASRERNFHTVSTTVSPIHIDSQPPLAPYAPKVRQNIVTTIQAS